MLTGGKKLNSVSQEVLPTLLKPSRYRRRFKIFLGGLKIEKIQVSCFHKSRIILSPSYMSRIILSPMLYVKDYIISYAICQGLYYLLAICQGLYYLLAIVKDYIASN